MLSHDPALLRIGKANTDQIRQLGTGPSARQGAIDPMGAAVGRLKQRAGVADRPTVRLVRECHIKKCRRTLTGLWHPRRTAVGRRENRAQRTDDCPMLLIYQDNGM